MDKKQQYALIDEVKRMKTSECIHSLLVAIADAGGMVDTQKY